MLKIVTIKPDTQFQKYDAIIILGHSIDDENLPGDWLLKRLNDALYLYDKNISDKIIVTGGQGPNDKIAVSQSMKQYLVAQGVLENNIYIENESRNTYENFKFSKSIAEKEDINSIIIVTNDFHMYRSALICKKFFDNFGIYFSNLDFDAKKFFAYSKEPFSIIKFYIEWSLEVYLRA